MTAAAATVKLVGTKGGSMWQHVAATTAMKN